MKNTFLILSLFFSIRLFSQDFHGLQSSNYAGVTGAFANPASIADNRFLLDVTLVGFNMGAANNYVGLKQSAFSFNFNKTYSDNDVLYPKNGKSKEFHLNSRLTTFPSFMLTLNKKNAIAFNVSLRNYLNFSGVSQQLADIMSSNFSDKDLLKKRLTNNKIGFTQAAWAEYGLTYARVMKEEGKHFVKAGITPKLIQGLEALYFNVSKLDYRVDARDTLSFFNTAVEYGYSSNLDNLNFNNANFNFKPFYSVGLDVGAVYEWQPDFEKYKYDMDGKTGLWRRDKNKYKLRASLSVTDIGNLKFNKGRWSNSVEANVNYLNLGVFSKANDFESLDSVMRANFSVKSSPNVKLALPTAINAQADYNIWKPFYVNLGVSLANLNKNRSIKIYDYSTISLAPRFEHTWFGFTLPFTYSKLYSMQGSPLAMGAMLRLGPLVIGSNDVLPFFSKDVFGASLYALIKVPIPYGRKRDNDKDGVSNKKDKCKNVPGVWEFKGCPDKDGDHVQDSEDKCPDVAGLLTLGGCPDKDSDGITDLEDACPDSAGTPEFKGCPDRDGDKIIDRNDACPDAAGLAEFNGCPDKDGDGTPDKDDVCPDVAGPKEFKGCPDKDGDGVADMDDACPDIAGPKEYKGCPDKDGDTVLDKDDGCPDVAGPVDNKGCPWPDSDYDGVIDKEDSCVTVPGELRFKGCPPPIKAAERKIIEKAFASLEFATGKDVIKPKSLPSLNELAKLLVKHQTEWTLKLAGHTDNEGKAEDNLLLSEKRAKAVKAYLVKKGALDEQIIAEWFGQTQPIADNATPQGRQKNRRVEMKIQFKE